MMSTKYNIEEIKKSLKECLSEERYIHSLGTMETAVMLAERFGCDVEKARTAGLLHDCAKCLSEEENEKYLYCLEDFEKNTKKTRHAPIGAQIAKEKYFVDDDEILSAIRWHTVGKKGMSDFEKIIFIADKIEHRTREPEFREKIEKVLEETQNLDAALLKSFKLTLKSLLKRDLPISFQTVDVYNDLLQRSGLRAKGAERG